MSLNFRNIKILIKKELTHYLNNPPSYVLASVFLIIIGYFFSQPLFLINQANLNSVVEIVPLIFTFLIPALSMKLISEEKKLETIEILLTLPFKEEEIIISKFISAVIIITSIILMMFPYSSTLYFLSKPDSGHIIGTYIAIILDAIALLSIGLFASTLSKSQIVAFIVAFGISFFLYVLGKIIFFIPLKIQNIANYIGTDMHISNIARGVIDLKDIIYFLSITVFFIYLSIDRIKRIRRV